MLVLMLLGKCLVTSSCVSPGNVVKCPFLIAFINVLFVGNPRLAWWNFAKSCFVFWSRIIPFALCSFISGCVGISTVHNPVLLSLGPCSISSCFVVLIITFSFSNVAVQSLSQSCPMDNRLPDASELKTLALFAFGGTFGIASVVVWFEVIVSPFGHCTFIGVALFVFNLLFFMRYVPVAPESGCAMILLFGWATRFEHVCLINFDLLLSLLHSMFMSHPLSHSHPSFDPPNFLS